MGEPDGPDACAVCGATWIVGEVCGSCGWRRGAGRELPTKTPEELELDLAATRPAAPRRPAVEIAPPRPAAKRRRLPLPALAVGALAVAGAAYLLSGRTGAGSEATEAPSAVAESSKPPPVRDLTAEGSKTGLGLAFGRLAADLRTLHARLARGLGIPSLGAALTAGRLRRLPDDEAHTLRAEAGRLRGEAERLREAVELRFGLRLGRLFAAQGRALGGLEATLDRLAAGEQAAEEIDLYEQWSHALLLKLERELGAKGVPVDQAAEAEPGERPPG